MTDFAERVINPKTDDFSVRSLMDVDFYKFTMGQFIFKNYAGVRVKFKLINRDPDIPVADVIPEEELRKHLDHVRSLTLRRTDLSFLRGMDVYGKNMFDEEYLASLSTLQLPQFDLKMTGDQFELSVEAAWEEATFWETIMLAVISELYYRNLMKRMTPYETRILYGRATDKLYGKLKSLKANGTSFSDFGQRRRHSFLWQQFALEMATEIMGDLLGGTSNTWMAFNQDLMPIGTNGHELPMVITAIAEDDDAKRSAQYEVLGHWEKLYGEGLLVMLPDTYGSEQFFHNMPDDLATHVAHKWRGQRQDSGDPGDECRKFINWLKSKNVNSDVITRKKINIFSDGLDVDQMINYKNEFSGKIIGTNGWGTKFTNDFNGCHPNGDETVPGLSVTWDQVFRNFSIVVKVVEANGKPVVKLSNNINKATGNADAIADYVRVFGHVGRGEQVVEV